MANRTRASTKNLSIFRFRFEFSPNIPDVQRFQKISTVAPVGFPERSLVLPAIICRNADDESLAYEDLGRRHGLSP
jgi:hypothetical protein